MSVRHSISTGALFQDVRQQLLARKRDTSHRYYEDAQVHRRSVGEGLRQAGIVACTSQSVFSYLTQYFPTSAVENTPNPFNALTWHGVNMAEYGLPLFRMLSQLY
jgi:hypothetical protein